MYEFSVPCSIFLAALFFIVIHFWDFYFGIFKNTLPHYIACYICNYEHICLIFVMDFEYWISSLTNIAIEWYLIVTFSDNMNSIKSTKDWISSMAPLKPWRAKDTRCTIMWKRGKLRHFYIFLAYYYTETEG